MKSEFRYQVCRSQEPQAQVSSEARSRPRSHPSSQVAVVGDRSPSRRLSLRHPSFAISSFPFALFFVLSTFHFCLGVLGGSIPVPGRQP